MQISLSGDSIDRYFRILEHYVLPLMVVSTIVLFCGYLASRIYHRTVHRKQPGDDRLGEDESPAASSYDGTAAFLRELKTTPPIEDPAPLREPKIRPQHPFLRKRAANAAAALRRPPAADLDPGPVSPAPAGDVRLAAGARAAARPSSEDGGRLTPAAGAPRFDPAPPERAAPAAASEPLHLREPLELTAELRFEEPRARAPMPPVAAPDKALRAARTEAGAADNRDGDAGRIKMDPPPVAANAAWRIETAEAARAEPAATVVQALKAAPAPLPADIEAARVRAGEIGDSLDYAASVLQQAAALMAQRLQSKQGLGLDDVRGMRIAGFDQPLGVLEDLRKLGGDVAEEVVAAYERVMKFDSVLRRLEQMAAKEPLDEGWNDLLRARVSDTLYAMGQVRKTLGGYRLGARKPAKPGDKPTRPGGAPGAGSDQPLPVGRRQL